jgi:DegV family protein with EDD domain
MNKVAIITERLASLSYKFAKELGIHLIPVNIIIGEKTMKDDNDAQAEKFLRDMPTFKDIPSTAVPSQGEMVEAFKEALKDTKKGIYISASKKLSSIYDRGFAAARKLNKEGYDIRVFDSFTTVSMEGMYAYEASQMAKNGLNIDEIEKNLIKIRDEKRIDEFGVINTLKYLEKNGRIGKAKAWLATLFRFKPIISAENGELEPVAKVRTDNQALELVVKRIKEDMEKHESKKIKVMYDYGINDEFLKEQVIPRIKEEFDPEVISINPISTAIACHLGPEVWGVCIYYL